MQDFFLFLILILLGAIFALLVISIGSLNHHGLTIKCHSGKTEQVCHVSKN